MLKSYLVRLAVLGLIVSGCDSNLNVAGIPPAAESTDLANDASAFSASFHLVSANEILTFPGIAYHPKIKVSIEGQEVETEKSENGELQVRMPAGIAAKEIDVTITRGNTTTSLKNVFNLSSDLPLITADPSTICSSQKFYNRQGTLSSGTLLCPEACNTDGQVDCKTTTTYKAAAVANLAAKVVSGATVAGVTGKASGGTQPPDCTTNGQDSCYVNPRSNFDAGDLRNLTPGNIRRGVSVAGVVGTFPSSSAPLPRYTSDATSTTESGSDLTDLTNFVTQLTTNGSFEYWSSTGQRYTGSGDSDLISSNIKNTVAIESLNLSGAQPPVNAAAGISFTDTDADVGEVGGNVTITKATNESDITHYVLYWGESATKNLTGQAAISTIAKTGSNLSYTFAANTVIPANAIYLIVYTKNADSMMATGVSTDIAELVTLYLQTAANARSLSISSGTTGIASYFSTKGGSASQGWGVDAQFYSQNQVNCIFDQIHNRIAYHLKNREMGAKINITFTTTCCDSNGGSIRAVKDSATTFMLTGFSEYDSVFRKFPFFTGANLNNGQSCLIVWP